AIFVDKGFPYKNGPLNTSSISITKRQDGSPLSSTVFYPTSPGLYGTFYFVTGANGMVVSSDYSDYLSQIASHGFVVISADLLWEDVAYAQRFGFHFGDLYIEQLTWMQDHLEELLSKTVPGVTCSWEHLGLGSHSAGADSTLYMVARNHTLYQTELATHHAPGFPPCMSDQFGYKHVWQLWQRPPRVRMEIKGYGHCDILNYNLWEECHKYHLCATPSNASVLASYHVFTQGVTSAFLTSYLTGYEDNLKYVTNRTLLPVETLDFAVDL
ncbi:hypothetical protein BaRGS_00023951, partial [Batillaria attramentaria]